ncbi:MAG: ribbon-helix-helix domain-containing protein [Lachnospiraceae bacterium]|nr:ribbon-helix-helix domain-containing protein [Lachnospiraceae bacterium]
MSPRTGRPKLEKPLSNDIKVRLDDELHSRLLEYCTQNGVSKAETIRKALIQLLDSDK